MDPRVKALWIAALRSGQYHQTENFLCTKGEDGSLSYCCLGVLCDLYMKENPDKDAQWKEGSESMQYVSGSGDTLVIRDSMLPKQVQDWAGLKHDNPDNPRLAGPFRDKLNFVSASIWNDDLKADFSEIADMIDASL